MNKRKYLIVESHDKGGRDDRKRAKERKEERTKKTYSISYFEIRLKCSRRVEFTSGARASVLLDKRDTRPAEQGYRISLGRPSKGNNKARRARIVRPKRGSNKRAVIRSRAGVVGLLRTDLTPAAPVRPADRGRSPQGGSTPRGP
jgi:hypothetical protein